MWVSLMTHLRQNKLICPPAFKPLLPSSPPSFLAPHHALLAILKQVVPKHREIWCMPWTCYRWQRPRARSHWQWEERVHVWPARSDTIWGVGREQHCSENGCRMAEAKLCWSSWPGACISTQKLGLAPRPNFWRRWSRLIIMKTKCNRRDRGFVLFPDSIFRARSSLATRLGGNYGMVGQSTCVCDYFYWHGLQQNAAEQSTCILSLFMAH